MAKNRANMVSMIQNIRILFICRKISSKIVIADCSPNHTVGGLLAWRLIVKRDWKKFGGGGDVNLKGLTV